MLRSWMVMAVLGTALVACGNGDGEDGETEGSSGAQPVQRVVTLSEGEALAILGAVHTGAADYARAAQDSVTNPELRRLLRVIRADHEALGAELQAIADSLKVTPAAHGAADQVRSTAQDALRALPPTRAGRDEAVLRSEIALQETILAVLDSTVLPGTRQPLLAQYVAAARPTIGAHLQRAHQVEVMLRERAEEAARRPTGITPAAPAATGTAEPRPAAEPRPDTPAPAPPDTTPPPAPPDTTAGLR